MNLLTLILTFAEQEIDSNPAEVITPYLPVIGVIAGGLVVGLFSVYNRKKGNVETRAPDVNEIWQQQQYQGRELDRESTFRRMLQSWGYEIVAAFRGYVLRVQSGGTTDLLPHERRLHDQGVPEEDRRANNRTPE